jgi:hypothetical protein
MAFSAVLEIGDNTSKRYNKQYLLTGMRLVFNRPYNVVPTGTVRCERIELMVVTPGKKDLFMFDWFLKSSFITGRIAVTLTGFDDNSDMSQQEIYFEDAQCFSLSELYDIDGSRRRMLKVSLISEEIEIGDVKFKCL